MKKRMLTMLLTLMLIVSVIPLAASATCKKSCQWEEYSRTAASCTQTGKIVYKCANCDDRKSETLAIDPTAHDYDKTTVVETVQAATCTTRGIVKYECKYCDATKKFNVDKLEHTPVDLKAKNPTCAETGLTKGSKCSVCDEILVAQTEVAKKPHTWDAVTAKCTKCDAVCDHEGTFDIKTPAKEATCTSGPICAEKLCSVCGYHQEAKATGGALGHSYKNSKCTVCGRVCSDHTLKTTVKAQAATCVAPATTARKECQVCDYVEKAKSTGDALGHKYNLGVVTTQPTCTEDGVKTFTCKNEINGVRCTDSYTEVIPAAGHKYSVDTCSVCLQDCDHEGTLVPTEEGRPANCYNAEYFPAVECTECNYTKDGYYHGVGLGHTWENGVCTACKAECVHNYEDISKATAATCEVGYTTAAKQCKVCKYVKEAEVITDPLGHDYNMGYVTTDATCLEDGVKTFTCKREGCGHKRTEPVAARGHHVYSTTAKLVDTCIYCMAKCDHKDTLVETEKGRPANCYDAEYFPAVKCTECNYTKAGYYYGTGLGHDLKLGDFVSTKPTCLDKGWGRYECQREGCEYTEGGWVPATGHNYEVVQEWKATCTVKGCTKSICKGCNLVRYEDTAPLGHSMQPKDGLEATCSVDGYTAYEQCERCDLIEGKEAIAAGHEIVDYQCRKCGLYLCDHDGEIEIVESTCSEHGTETFSCETCGYEHTKELPLAEHDVEVETTAATCTEAGVVREICSVCEEELSEIEIPATGHNFVRGTCTNAGCGAKESGRVPSNGTSDRVPSSGTSGDTTTGGSMSGSDNNTEDSTTGGSMSGTGSSDGSTSNGRPEGVVPACGHSHTTTVTQAKTCTSNGSTITYCTDCNTVVTTTVDAATGHNYVLGICATCKAQDPSVYTGDYNNYYIVGNSGK